MGPGDDRGRRIHSRRARLRPAPGAAARAVRPADGQRAEHAHAARRRSLAIGRNHPARDPAACLRRPHPRRRGAFHQQRAARRAARARDLRRQGRGNPLHHGRIRSGGVLRARVCRAGRPADHRHGVAFARSVLVRRRRQGVLRAHDRARVDGRGLPRVQQCVANYAAGAEAIEHSARGDRPAAARDVRSGRRAADPESQRIPEVPLVRPASGAGPPVATRAGDT